MFGLGIFLITAIIIGLPMGIAVNPVSIILGASAATLFTMIGLEIKDKAKGGKFDWKDINAGMIAPIIINIAMLISIIIG